MIEFLLNLVHRYGDIGLFLYCLIGPVTYMPIGPDVFLIARSMACRCFPVGLVASMVVAYAISGSINYFIGRFMGHRLKSVRSWLDRFREPISRYGFWGLLMVSAGPIPVREGSIVAGFMEIPYLQFLAAMLVGTSVRFALEGSAGLWLV